MPLQQTSGNVTADAYGGGVAAKVNYIENYFQTWLRTGTGASTTVTTGLDASTNKALVWTKSRSAATDNKLTDTVRGATKALISNTTGAQTTDTNGLTAFSSTGYTIGTDTNYNNSGATYVDWEFAATPKFFDIVTYTGTGSATTIAHSLGSVPGCIMVKRIDTTGNWQVYHNGLTSAAYSIQLNSTAAQASATTVWNSTAPTTSVFSVGTDATVNASGGTYVAYIYAHNAGGFGLTGTDNVISCGSYTNTSGSTATVNITLGYEPQWILRKRISTARDWSIQDVMRGFTADGADQNLYPNLTAAETTESPAAAPNAAGFSLAVENGATYIYIAIRRGPMKVPTDATKVFTPQIATASDTVSNTVTTNFPVDLSINQYRNANYPTWMDRLRGDSKTNYVKLTSAATTVEATGTNGLGFDNNTGYVDNYNWYNIGAGPVVYWNFRRAPGFFDEVCYTSNYSGNPAVSHNLGVVPELLIFKDRSDSRDWEVYAPSILGSTYTLYLNQIYAKADVGTSTTLTTTTFQQQSVQYPTAKQYVAYLFATCPGVSKVGSYTGNGTTQTINCGFTGGARFVLIKRTDATGGWYTYDTARGMTVLTDPYLLLNSTAAETATLGSVTTVTTGFAVNEAILTGINTSSATYIFLSVA